ncbi:aldo/keto reductase [Bradyrhizobium sp. BR 1432]|uniref:aldo/keto reductase n=1 Tax=Bradyrhizobium sp. BR 1432 TaxID=3447966 RepID=UPI003EE4D08A
MKTRQLGSTGISVSQAILGCGEFGGVGARTHLIGRGLTREASFASLDEAVRLGINVLDTAYSYAGGASSRFIGEWLRAQPAPVRRSVHIATKVGKVVEPSGVRVDLSPRKYHCPALAQFGTAAPFARNILSHTCAGRANADRIHT